MTTLLSTVVIAFLATCILNAVLSTSAWTAENCLARPTGRLPHGNHWRYETNPTTHKKCWVVKAGNSIASESPAARKKAAREARAAVLPPAVADANARFEDTFTALRSHATALAAEAANENPSPSKFESLWIDLSDPADSSDRQSNPVGRSMLGDVKKYTKARGHSYATERWPDVSLMVFLVSLGGALVLYASIGHSFLVAGPTPTVRRHLPTPDDIFRVPSDLDTSDSGSASTVKPEHDLQAATDAQPGEIGGSRVDDDPTRLQRRAPSYRLTNPFAGLG
jgi:hypothetical protein